VETLKMVIEAKALSRLNSRDFPAPVPAKFSFAPRVSVTETNALVPVPLSVKVTVAKGLSVPHVPLQASQVSGYVRVAARARPPPSSSIAAQAEEIDAILTTEKKFIRSSPNVCL